ncbi:MAG: N-acetyltransferase [Pontixanthobacter sp.]
MSAIILRPEQDGDADAIRTLSAAAYADTKYSDGSEPELIDRLRNDGDLSLSLVAENEQGVVGHIAFSPVRIMDGTKGWFGLGPVSVASQLQGQRIGFSLVQRGIADMREMNANGIVVLGDPGYFGQFGFENDPQLTFDGYQPELFQRLMFDGKPPKGAVIYSKAFS